MGQGDLPLVQTLLKYLAEKKIRLHMPGHKGGQWGESLLKELIGSRVFAADLTELPGLDDLHNPEGSIREAERLAAQLFGSAASFFLINGASAGIEAAMMAFSSTGDKVIVPRASHRSTLNGLILSGARPVYIQTRYTLGQIPLPLQAKDLKKIISGCPQCRAVCLVSPTYEGIAVDLAEISSAVKEDGLKLVVDEAHGAHFYFHPSLPVPALKYAADAVIHGTHKTLGSLTQTGMLHLRSQEDIPRVRNALSLLQSTSPSYLLMASLDAARKQAALSGSEALEQLLQLGNQTRIEINQIKGFWCPDEELIKDEPDLFYDATKLIIGCCSGLTGYEISRILQQDYKIDVEMAKEAYVLAMLAMGDREPVLSQLVNALKEVSRRFNLSTDYSKMAKARVQPPPLPEVVMTPREAFFGPQREIPFAQAAGEISGETIAAYPPGIPLICPGERFDHDILEVIAEFKRQGVHWQGSSDPTLEAVRILDI